MRHQLVTVPFQYRIGFIPKMKRLARPHVVSASMTVSIVEYQADDAPPVVAKWRPRPDEFDGEPIEIRHDCRRFLAPVFPNGRYDYGRPLEGTEPRLTSGQLLTAIRDPKVASGFFGHFIVAPDGEKEAIPEADLSSVLGAGRVDWSARTAMETGLAELADRFVLIDGRPFREIREPLIKIDENRPMRVDGNWTSKRQLSLLLDLSSCSPFEFDLGRRLFRLTHADRARQSGLAQIGPRHEAGHVDIDLEIFDPAVFVIDDLGPAIGHELVDAAREWVSYGRIAYDDKRRLELHSILWKKDQYDYEFGKHRAAAWNDPELPRAAELLRDLLLEGLVEERYRDRVSAAVDAFENRPGVDRSLSLLDEQLLGAIAP